VVSALCPNAEIAQRHPHVRLVRTSLNFLDVIRLPGLVEKRFALDRSHGVAKKPLSGIVRIPTADSYTAIELKRFDRDKNSRTLPLPLFCSQTRRSDWLRS
jgi:hypothetical protein